MGIGFELRIVGGDQSRASAFEQVFQDGTCQRRALLWIGACPQLVEDDQ